MPPAEPSVPARHPSTPQRSVSPDLRLFKIGCLLVGAVLAYYGYAAHTPNSTQTGLGLMIIFLAALPSLLWARQSRIRYPIFEIFILTTGNVYALPLLNGHEMLLNFTSETVNDAALGIILYQATAIVVYLLTQGRPLTTSFWTENILSERVTSYLSYGMVINTVYTVLNTFFDVIPVDLSGLLRGVCFGIGIICIFVTTRLWGAGQLPQGQKAFFILNFAIQFFLPMTTLYLVNSISLLLLGLLGYVSGSRRLPVVFCACILPMIALLHQGKTAMRERYWAGGKPAPTLIEVPGFFSEWIGEGLRPPDQGPEGSGAEAMTEKLLQRTSLFHLMCLVVSLSPDQQPYLHGDTYQDILLQFVPRPFWPGKPNALAGTYRLAIYYGLQSEEDVQKTTIGFGMLTEAYANYGFFGLMMLGGIFGFFFKKIQSWAAASPIFSYPGLFLILLVAWSFQTEFTLSVWLSSMFQATVAVVGIPFALRKMVG